MPLTHALLLLTICLLWAGNFLAAAVAMRHFEPITFTVVRFGLVLILLLVLLRRPPRAQWLRLIGCCWSMGAIHFALIFLALKRSADLSSVALLMQVYVPLSSVLAAWLLGERFGWQTGLAIGIAFAGVLVMGLDPMVLAQLEVVGLVLASALALAIGTVLMRGLNGVKAMSFLAWNAALSLPPLIVLAAWLEQPFGSLDALRQPAEAWFAVLFSAAGASIVGHGSFFWLIQRHEVHRITGFLLLVPLLAVALSVAFWGDRPGPRLILGGALILGGVLWLTLRAKRRNRRRIPEPPI